MDRFIERLLVASRWLLAPLYLGLALVLVLFIVYFFVQLAHLVAAVVSGARPHLVLTALSLIDVVLIAGLIVMVMISGFDDFVAKVRLDERQAQLGWLTRLDPSALKVKIVGSIAVISAIYLLEQFFDIDNTEAVASGRLLWMVIIHLVFVVTAVLLAVLDRMSDH